MQLALSHIRSRRKLVQQLGVMALLILLYASSERIRSCQRVPRNRGWWDMVWNTNNEDRFKKTFRVSRATFHYILANIRHDLERETYQKSPFPQNFDLVSASII